MKSHDRIAELLASIQAGLYAQQRRAARPAPAAGHWRGRWRSG